MNFQCGQIHSPDALKHAPSQSAKGAAGPVIEAPTELIEARARRLCAKYAHDKAKRNHGKIKEKRKAWVRANARVAAMEARHG